MNQNKCHPAPPKDPKGSFSRGDFQATLSPCWCLRAQRGGRAPSPQPCRGQNHPITTCFIYGLVSCIIQAKDSGTTSRLTVPGLRGLHREQVLFQQQRGEGSLPRAQGSMGSCFPAGNEGHQC